VNDFTCLIKKLAEKTVSHLFAQGFLHGGYLYQRWRKIIEFMRNIGLTNTSVMLDNHLLAGWSPILDYVKHKRV
jgi:hypothetical protein